MPAFCDWNPNQVLFALTTDDADRAAATGTCTYSVTCSWIVLGDVEDYLGFTFTNPSADLDVANMAVSAANQFAYRKREESGYFDSPHIVVCEGELDAIVTSAELGIPAVGVPGVAAWKNHFPKLFVGYETIYVVGDNDVKEDGSNPGAEFAKRVANEVMNSQIVTLPPGMDINDYYLANGIDATRKLLIGESNV